MGLETIQEFFPGEIYSFEILHPEWCNNKNSAFKKKLSRLLFIATTVATLASSTGNPDILVLGVLEDIIPKMKRSLFGIENFIKQLQKGDNLNGILLNKSTQNDMVTDEVGVPNNFLRA